jgi:hypothetical protein
VINPIEQISRCRTRLANLAAWRVIVTATAPIAITVAAGLGLKAAAALVWNHWGYLIQPETVAVVRNLIFMAVGGEVLAAAYFTRRAWKESNDFAKTAERIDDLVGARQELITLATFADPSRPDSKDGRSPLFAILWRHAIAYLRQFDPRREFRFEAGEPLRRSSIFSGAIAIALGLAMLALMRLPTATQAAAYRLRQYAASADTPGATPEDRQIAEAARGVAKDLDNPQVPPPQKLAELQAIKRAIEQFQADKSNQQSGAGNANGNGNGAGKGSGGGSGDDKGNGGGEGGAGNDASAKGSGAGAGSKSGGGDKNSPADAQSAKLDKDLAKAEAKLQEESTTRDKNLTADNQDKNGTGLAPQGGGNPNQPGPQSNPNGAGSVQLPDTGKLAQSEAPPSAGNPSGHRDDKGSLGDTHLGDFPKAASYERYYKLGDKGPAIDLKNARYVTFRLPTSMVAGSAEGKAVRDTGSPTATTPYTNAPLKENRLAASPDEEQLVPPRYRDLLK